ncbi:hypothetical protein F383_27654 [Gossypium arboreum]|uniref:Uncharacterized protein n=1 Tax=Gossypium arboreum TaxID=29729 RepID=A0A0B0P731_GOSAR|nr:hypothetical protein F383_27654 [Gossypium arboreum]
MDRSVSPVMWRSDEYSSRRLSTNFKPHEPFLGTLTTFG